MGDGLMPLLVFSLDGYTRSDQIKDFNSLSAVERDLDTGSWQIEMPLGSASSPGQRWLNLPKAGIEIYDPDQGFTFAGFVTNYEISYSKNRNTLKLVGKDFQARLAQRIAAPQPGNLSRWWQTTPRTLPLLQAAYWIVDRNCGAFALPQRRIEMDQVPYPGVEGDPVTWTSDGGSTVLDTIRGFLLDTAWTARLKLQRKMTSNLVDTTTALDPSQVAAKPVFNIGARPYSGLVLNVSTLSDWSTGETAAKATWAIAQGSTFKDGVKAERLAQHLAKDDPDPPVRYITEYGNPATAAEALSGVGGNWRTEYVEELINKAADNVPALSSQAADYIRVNGPKRSVHVNDVDVPYYGNDLDVGWLVPLFDAEAPEPTLPIPWEFLPVTQFTLNVTPEQTRRTITLGTRKGDSFDSIFKPIREALEIAARVDRIIPRQVY
jgi:hypothetical protein